LCLLFIRLDFDNYFGSLRSASFRQPTPKCVVFYFVHSTELEDVMSDNRELVAADPVAAGTDATHTVVPRTIGLPGGISFIVGNIIGLIGYFHIDISIKRVHGLIVFLRVSSMFFNKLWFFLFTVVTLINPDYTVFLLLIT